MSKWRPLCIAVLRAVGLGTAVWVTTGKWELALSLAAFEIGSLTSFVGSMLEASHDER